VQPSHSRRRWSPERAQALEEPARRILVVELDGVLFFGNAQGLESAIEAVPGTDIEHLILDFRRVPDMDTSGARALLRIHQRARRSGIELHCSWIRGEREGAPDAGLERAARLRLRGALEDAGLIDLIGPGHFFEDTDDALAHCEDALLARYAAGAGADPSLADALMLRGFDRGDFRALRPRMQRICFAPESVVFEQGSAGDAIYLVLRGHAEIRVDGQQGGAGTVVHRLRPGSVFGEMSVLDGEPRAASVHARSTLTCYRMSVADFRSLQRTHPRTALRIHGNLALVFARRLRAANALVAELEH
jgi:CRP-like cAMP-binding protein/anti-anti-sigma regulatory factor